MPREPEYSDERLMDLVEATLALPGSQREQWVWQNCGNDTVLAHEALLRIGWETEMEGFLSEPILGLSASADLQPGQQLGERLRIVRKIAAGGMATVYEAEDKNIGAVAIKVPKPEYRRKLLSEARLALQVTHPNICRVHGIDSARTEDAEVSFLTMEYLEGETLQERLQRVGPLPLAEFEELAEQLCAGLAEAHRRGVVHGDLKGSNVILTARDGSTCAVITDFGLARAPGHGAFAGGSSIRGTPDFLAPEIWTGGAFSISSDLYALGVLLYEAATGKRPFPDDPSRRDGAELVPCRRRRRDLPRRWSLVIDSCLSIVPGKRPPSADAVARAFRPLWGFSTSALVLSAVLLVLAGLAGITLRDAPADPVRVAVLPIDSDTDSASWGNGALRQISNILPSYRSAGGGVVVIPSFDSLGQDPASTLKRAGATHLIRMRFRKAGTDVRADLSITDTRSGQELKSFSGSYTQASIGSLPKALVAALTAALQLYGSRIEVRIKPAAWSEYLRGEGELQRPQPDLDAAISAFQEAAKLDPTSSLPWAGMASALQRKYALKNDHKVLDSARNTLQEAISRGPDDIEVHLAAGSVWRASGLPERARAEYSRVLEIEPGNVEAMRRLAQTYEDMKQPVEAVQTWQNLESKLPNYYRTYLDLGRFYYYRARYSDAAKQFQRVTELAPDVAMGYQDLGAVYNDLGKFAEAEEAFRHALTMREHSDSLIGLGAVMDYERRTAEAVAFYERARQVGPVTYILLMDLGDAYRRLGRNADAKQTYGEALALADRDLGERPDDGYIRAFAAYLSARLGDRARAERELGQALRQSPDETKVKRTAIQTYGALGRVEDAELILASEPFLQDEMSRQPDVSEFSPKLRFKK